MFCLVFVMAFKDTVTEMTLFTLLWKTTLRPSLQMWKLRQTRWTALGRTVKADRFLFVNS